ncbi:MAG TPA: TonB family protein [Thermoanaerobaculia bacterium]|nr:TonB family protein [Thermoanaerobaculia bacterium]
MPDRSLPYVAFGRYILFRKLEERKLDEVWRAARIEGNGLGPTVALHRFTGGNRQAMRQAAAAARGIVGRIEGATIARGQVVEVAEGVVVLAHEYAGGRSLRAILDRAASAPHPIPVDQALAITERLAASAQTLQEIRLEGRRLVHGALIPQLVWMTEDGEVRVAGHQMSKGILAALDDAEIRAEIGSFFPPEVLAGGEPSPQSDVYAIGATLFLALTGRPAPDPGEPAALGRAIREAVLMFDEEPIPDEVRPILETSLAPDPGGRYGSADELHQALAKLVAGGRYAPTTFNLAFYLHTLLKREMEEEAEQRKEEERVDPAPYLERTRETPPRGGAVAVAAPAAAGSSLFAPSGAKGSRAALVAAALVLAAAVGAGAFWAIRQRPSPPESIVATPAPPVHTESIAAVIDTPVLTAVAEPDPEEVEPPAEGGTTTADEELRQKAFEEEVSRRLREEIARLQADYERQLAAARAKIARIEPLPPRPEPAAPPAETATVAAEPVSSAPSDSALDPDRLNRQRLDQIQRSSAEDERLTTTSSPPAPAADPPPAQRAVEQPAAPPPAPAVREGDLIDLSTLDQPPALVRIVLPEYPALARRQRFETTLIISALVDENGEVRDVRVLRGDARKLGFEEAAVRAVRASKFSTPMKDGVRVRTWIAFPVIFQLPR